MIKWVGLLLGAALAAGCTGGPTKQGQKRLNFGAFSIEVPHGWKKIIDQGIDSYVGRIATDNSDTLYFDLGWYSNTLSEPDYYRSVQPVSGKKDPVDTALTFVMDGNTLRAVPKKNHCYWDSIDGRKAKMVVPKQTGVGTTGIYIDSLWRSGSDFDRFCLYGENLKSENQQQFLQALKTLHFKDRH